jgi:cation diffusion facilitator family transporter
LPSGSLTFRQISIVTAQQNPLRSYAYLSLAAALITIGLKSVAFVMTGSIGLLSDAAESFVNLAGALMALAMLSVASRPPDDDHTYGHGKAEYFSSGVEGTLILLAAIGIIVAAVPRLINPQPIQQIGAGLIVSVVASLINLAVSLILLRAAKRNHSVTLEANGQHLLTDVWTTGGVIVGVGAVGLTDWQILDPIVAVLVAANIVLIGVRIVRKSILGLMDTALPRHEQDTLRSILAKFTNSGEIQYHALRTRQSGARRFISMHVVVPGEWTVHQGHTLLERIEGDIRESLPNVTVLTHLESLDDPSSWDDVFLDRSTGL